LVLIGCAGFSISTNTNQPNLEALGSTLGTFMKIKHEDTVLKTIPWVEGMLLLTDDEFVAQDPIAVAYEFLLKEFPDDAEIITLLKATVDAFGISVTVDGEINENKYIQMAKELFKGFLKGVKV
jgi:hypothetical protein